MMHNSRRILLIEPSANCRREIVAQLAPGMSFLAHRVVAHTTDLTQALQEENWDAVVCSNGLPDSNALHSFFANLPGMACQIGLSKDGKLHFPYVSEGCFSLLGITPLEIELRPELLLDMLHPADRDAFYKSMHESAAGSSPWNWEGRIVLPPNDDVKWVNLRATHRQDVAHSSIWEGFMVNITQNKQAEIEVQQSRQRLRELSSHIESIKEEERMRIAREIHDEIGVLMTALKMDIAWLAQRLPHDNMLLQDKVLSMSKLLDTAGSSANNLVHSLRPGFLDCFGIVAAIEIEAKEFTKRTGTPCKILKQQENIALPGEQSITIFRVFQETLNNIMKHAAARQVQIQILIDEKSVGLIVADDGKGFDDASRNKPRSFGLRGIQERIGHLGGEVEIASKLGQGSQISVWMPLQDNTSAHHKTKQQQIAFGQAAP